MHGRWEVSDIDRGKACSEYAKNLIFIGMLASKGCSFEASRGTLRVFKKNKEMMSSGGTLRVSKKNKEILPSGGTLRVFKDNKEMLRESKTKGLYRLEESV